jgi:hypothetical protein
MRFIGLLVLIGVIVCAPLAFSVWGQLTVVPWYLVGVLIFCAGNVLFSYSIGEVRASWRLFFQGVKADTARHRALASMHHELSRQALAGGFFVMLVGWVALFSNSQPPLVEDFGRSVAAPIFALIIGWCIHRPLGNWHLRMASE